MKPQKIMALLSLFSFPVFTKDTKETSENNTTTITPVTNENNATTNVTTTEVTKNQTAVANSTKIPGNLTNVLLCKVTHLGVDYAGTIGKSESGVRCQSWTAKNPMHKVDPLFTDDKFSDFSKSRAKHYCRNPNNEHLGPWCYTMDPDNIWETCGLPLCSYTECRITGPGMEYAGFNKKTITGRNCLKWNKKRPKVQHGKDTTISLDKYDSHLFPDEIRSDAKKFCRNPDGDIGGPWCFVETASKKIVEKQFCDVPFCHDETCMVFTKNDDTYTHYTKFSEHLQNFTFGVKLWDPDQFLNASARLVLSLHALPLIATQIHDLGIGVEITITNKKTAVTAGYANKVEYEDTKGFIKGHTFVYFSLTWWHNVITLFLDGKKQPILMADLNSKDSVMSHKLNQFSFYSAQGTNMLWNFPFCDIEDQCDVFTTTQKNFQQFHPLRETAQGRDLEFHLRAFRSAYLLLVSSPTVQYPNFVIMLQRSDNITRFMYKNDENSSAEVIAEIFSDNILKYWTFQEFAVSIFLEECHILVTKNGATHNILTVKHDSLKKMRWFSPSSEDTIAHWTFFCFPPDEARAPTPWLPECVLNKNEPYYNGTQAVTGQGNPCLPWAGQTIMPVEINKLFKSKEDKFKANNYCRDPKNEQKGTFCYTFQYDDKDLVVRQEKCHIRRCKSAECKMAGTGNDYIGKLSTTRSNRTCQHWLSSSQLKHLEYTAKKVTENSTVQNVTVIEDPDAAASNKQKQEQLQVLNNYLDSTQCEDKLRCLRSMLKVRHTRSNETIANEYPNTDQEDNLTQKSPRGPSGSDEHVNDSLKPAQEYSEAEPNFNKTQTTQQSKNDQNSNDKNQTTAKEKSDSDGSTETNQNLTHENPESDPYFNISHNPPHELEVMHLEEIGGNPLINKMVEEEVETQTSKYDYPYVHEVDQVLLNETLFADMNLLKIENFCRNPNRDVGGAWCYTTDPHVRFDLCNVRDCDKPEECTVIVLGGETGRKNYILPQWKETGHHGGIRVSLKQWNPDLITSFAFEFFPFETMNQSMKIIIGAEENEKLQCYFNGELVKQKTLPHLIPTGKWTGFWIQIRQGEIMIGFEGVPNSFFEWKHDHFGSVFNPILVNYYSQNHLPIGAYFGCDDCQLENVTTAQFTRFFPIGLWLEEGQTYKNFSLKVRGTGNLLIPLYILPNTHEFYAIEIGTKDGTVKVYQYGPGLAVTRKTTFNKDFQIPTNAWANLTIIFTETKLMVISNTEDVMFFQSKKANLLFYYFSVGVQNGWITWAANCDPIDIDGPPIDGGWSKWSPWVCTVTCGGGQGYRTRTCSNPRPNVFGKMCEGSATSTGSCNEFECGDVSPETLDMIRQHLRENYTSLVVDEGDTVSIMNYPAILDRITTESPESYYEWTKNGLFLEPEPGRLEFSGDDIIISKATTKDSGVYVTMLFRINKQRVVLHVVTLAVNTKSYMIDTRATRKATLLTHSVVLGYVYKDLRQKWTLNDQTYIDYGITTMAAVSQEYLHPLNETHTGDWRCIVEQSDMKFRWTTNIIKIRVKTAPTLWTNLMEDDLTAPLFAWMKTEANVQIALAVLVVVVLGSVALGLFLYLRVCRLKQPRFEKKRAKKQKRNRRFR